MKNIFNVTGRINKKVEELSSTATKAAVEQVKESITTEVINIDIYKYGKAIGGALVIFGAFLFGRSTPQAVPKQIVNVHICIHELNV